MQDLNYRRLVDSFKQSRVGELNRISHLFKVSTHFLICAEERQPLERECYVNDRHVVHLLEDVFQYQCITFFEIVSLYVNPSILK